MPDFPKSFSISGLIFVTCVLSACSRTELMDGQSGVVSTQQNASMEMSASPYELFYGLPATWSSPPSVTFSFAANFPSQFQQPCMAAAQTWNAQLGPNFFQFSTTPQANTITWGAHPVPPNSTEAALTTVSGMGPDKQHMHITQANIDFDATANFTTGEGGPTTVDLQSVCLHEFGHALGLAHVPDKAAIMYPVIKDGTQKRALTQEDITHALNLY